MARSKVKRYNAKFNTLFFERYARLNLIDKLGERYIHLINDDRPDLQFEDRSLGIEVTRAIAEDKNVAHALINEMAGKHVTDVKKEVVDALETERSGYAYGWNSNWVGKLEYDYWHLALPMRRIVESKVKKVADGFYGDFQQYGLYIFTHQDLVGIDIETLIRFTIDVQKNKPRYYSYLYVMQVQELIVCDLTSGEHQIYPVTQEESREYYRKALYNLE